MAQSENVTAIENAVAQMNSGNLEGYLEVYSDDLTLHGYPPEVQGKEGVSAFYAAFAKAFPDIQLSVDDAMADGDKVAIRYSFTGTHRDEFMGVPASGNKVEVDGQSFFRFVDGRIAERWQSLDVFSLMTQIGAIPAPA